MDVSISVRDPSISIDPPSIQWQPDLLGAVLLKEADNADDGN